jgi:hypothetical protein
MKVKRWKTVFVCLVTVTLIGCGDDKGGPAEIPKDLNKELPKVAAPAGGGGAAKKPANPTTKAD